MILCQEIIWLSTDKVNTYCMREKGHSGKHNIVNEEPKEEEEKNEDNARTAHLGFNSNI
jgi:hypothetical protein